MQLSAQLLLLSGLTSFAAAHVLQDTSIVHERRDLDQQRDIQRRRIDRDVLLPMRVGLKENQHATANAEAWLMEVSHPDSKSYGQHWSQDEVIEAFKPSDETVAAVTQWLHEHDIAPERIVHTDNKQWLAFDATVEEAERILKTQYHEEVLSDGRSVASCDEYHIPRHLQQHIDFITPGVKTRDITGRVRKRDGTKRSIGASRRLGHSTAMSEEQKSITAAKNASSLARCDKLVTPACIRALYQFQAPDSTSSVSGNNTLGVFEEGDGYDQKDLNLFFNKYTVVPNGTHPILDSIDGGKAPVRVGNTYGEAVMDFQLSIPIIYPQKTTLYQTDDEYYSEEGLGSGLFNTFLDAVDGSYCNYSAYGETGNDPKLDPKYPDKEGGYKGQLMCGTYKPTNVVSISYGEGEGDLPIYYQKRQCNEWMKLALQGTSVLISSGDSGVSNKNGCLGKKHKIFAPSMPVGCPWVTGVGATRIAKGNSIDDTEVAAHDRSWGFHSGGGFSNIFSTPSYQIGAVADYFNTTKVSYPYYYDGHYKNATNDGIYNRNGRGIPDVAANGQYIATYVNGSPFSSGGTSASAPIFAALMNRIIEERIKVGKGPLGFLNPTFYKHPEVLKDIVEGNNAGCHTKGFECSAGWDPVTGLGVPNYPKMLELFLSLP